MFPENVTLIQATAGGSTEIVSQVTVGAWGGGPNAYAELANATISRAVIPETIKNLLVASLIV
jgi:hypothetical protein